MARARVRFDGELLTVGFGGAVGAWISDWVAGMVGTQFPLGGWGGPIARFLLGGFAIGMGRGVMKPFMLGFGIVAIALAVRDAVSAVGFTFPALTTGGG